MFNRLCAPYQRSNVIRRYDPFSDVSYDSHRRLSDSNWSYVLLLSCYPSKAKLFMLKLFDVICFVKCPARQCLLLANETIQEIIQVKNYQISSFPFLWIPNYNLAGMMNIKWSDYLHFISAWNSIAFWEYLSNNQVWLDLYSLVSITWKTYNAVICYRKNL